MMYVSCSNFPHCLFSVSASVKSTYRVRNFIGQTINRPNFVIFFVPTYFFVARIGGSASFSYISLLFSDINRLNSKDSTFLLTFLEENIGQI